MRQNEEVWPGLSYPAVGNLSPIPSKNAASGFD